MEKKTEFKETQENFKKGVLRNDKQNQTATHVKGD